MMPICQVRGLTKYYGDRLALRDVSLEIRSNEILGLLGPNGAGKTTLVRIIATLLAPTGGTVTVCGHNVMEAAPDVRPLVAIVPQGATPDPFATPWEHTYLYLRARGLPRRLATARSREVLRSLELWEHRDLRAQQLSGGFQRRILLAMALATTPRLLLLDEPTTALDPGARRLMWNLLADLRRDTSILLTTHDMHEAAILSDRIALLDGGTLAATDTLDRLLDALPSREKVVVYEPSGSLPIDGSYGTVVRVAGRALVYPASDEAARALGGWLLDDGVRFSIQPVDLEDAYFHFLSERERPEEPAQS